MKKILSKISSLLLLTPVVLTTACSFSFLWIDLANLPDYDWASEEPYFNHNYPVVSNISSVTNSGDRAYLKNQHYIDYKNFNTGFKNSKGVKKQAVTGAPLNSAFLPNGNFLKDFGENQKSLMFQQENSILDWDPNVDHDAKYNQSDIKPIGSEKVASKWVNSQDSNPNLKTLIMGLGVKSTSGESSVVGSNRMFNYNFNNWQYVDNYVAWAGAADEGIIVPPAADDVNAAHINGTKIFGQIYLDGYNGLTKSMLRDYVKKDANGNYKIVNILINMAKYLGFDGWFYNNEPNGFLPNGTILDSQISINIINQFKQTVEKSNDPLIHNLQIISYKNYGTLSYSNNSPSDQEASSLANATEGNYLQDFYNYPNTSVEWSKNHPQYNNFDIYNMYNLGGWVGGKIFYNEQRIGTRDIRELSQIHLDCNGQPYIDEQQENRDMNNNAWTFSNKNINSLAIFAATTPVDLASTYLNNLGHPPTIQDDIFATEYANYYDDMVYTGRHRALSNNDKGSTSWSPNFDVNGLSYGIGDIKLENTILFDDVTGNNNVRFFKTDFSTGQGKMFYQNENNGAIIKKIDNYPWNNRRLEDTQPTYKWDIKNANDGTANSNVMGYYDYYDAYAKGNSLALGAASYNGNLGFDNAGHIKPTTFSNDVDWNIMGTNYSKSDKAVDITYKITDGANVLPPTLASDFIVNLIATVVDNNGHERTVTINTSSTPKSDGWITLTANNLGTLAGNEKISKLGLRISPQGLGKTTKIKFNVGELAIRKNTDALPNLPSPNPTYITNLSSEYAIERSNYYSLRLNWTPDISLHEQVAYYEIYLQKDGKTYFLGATTNNNYYVKNLHLENGSKIIIGIINKYDSANSRYQSWNLV